MHEVGPSNYRTELARSQKIAVHFLSAEREKPLDSVVRLAVMRALRVLMSRRHLLMLPLAKIK